MRKRDRALIVIGVVASLCAAPIATFAQNSDDILLGDDASLLAGAVTAIVNDGSALYYNPAGLQLVDRNTVDLSISAYTLRLYRVPDAIMSTSGVSANANVTEVLIIPAAASYVRTTRSGLRIGFGVFATSLADYNQRTGINYPDVATGLEWEWLIQLANEIAVYHGIFGVGWSTPSRRLHFGTTLDVSYIGFSQSAQIGGGLIADQQTGEAALAASSSSRISLTGIGIRLGLGILWKPTEAISVGAAFQTASYLVFQSISTQSVQTAGVSVPPESLIILETIDASSSDFEFDQFEPYRWRLGFAYDFGKVVLSLDGDIQLDQEISTGSWNPSFNGRLGLLTQIDDAWSLGFGAFTNRSSLHEDPVNFGDASVDFYGFTVGVKLNKTRLLAPSEDTSSITFESTISVRYAIGIGEFAGAEVTDDISTIDPDDPELVELNLVDLRIHDIAIYVGGGIRF
jgi:hypothetical protein